MIAAKATTTTSKVKGNTKSANLGFPIGDSLFGSSFLQFPSGNSFCKVFQLDIHF